MNATHSTCHLCPTAQCHRFYRDAWALHQHISESHLTCSYCDPKEAFANGLEFGFRTSVDLNHHIKYVHRITTPQQNICQPIKHGFRMTSRNESRELTYLDMDFTSADPNRLWRMEHGLSDDSDEDISAGKRSSHQQRGGGSLIAERPTSLIPANMRIAGRVTGAGRFLRTAEDDAMQALADELAAVSQSSTKAPRPHTGGNNWASKLNVGKGFAVTESFPSLPTSSASPVLGEKSEVVDAAIERNRQRLAKQVTKEESNVEGSNNEADLLEQRIARRQLLLAQALGVDISSTKGSTAALGVATELLKSAALTSEELSTVSKKEWDLLRRPLFPAGLVQWARKNKHELAKIEKK